MKQLLLGIALLAVIGGGIWYWQRISNDVVERPPVEAGTPTQSPQTPRDISVVIEDRAITLVNGESIAELVPGSASRMITRYFGNEATGDLNGDGMVDTAFLITSDSGGSGTFYYVVVALKIADSYQGTNAVLLGDRIAPQTTEIREGELIVNYADRKPGEPMTARPSVGVSKYFMVIGQTLVEIVSSASKS